MKSHVLKRIPTSRPFKGQLAQKFNFLSLNFILLVGLHAFIKFRTEYAIGIDKISGARPRRNATPLNSKTLADILHLINFKTPLTLHCSYCKKNT